MRLLMGVLLIAPVLAGCLDDTSTDETFTTTIAGPTLDVYIFRYPGSDVVRDILPRFHTMFIVHNRGDADMDYTVRMIGSQGMLGRADGQGLVYAGNAGDPAEDTLVGKGSRLWTMDVAPDDLRVGLNVTAWGDGWRSSYEETWSITVSERLDPPLAVLESPWARPGDHVLTQTVGMWLNGTSFYTNIPSLLHDPRFPAGGHIDRAAALDAAVYLPIYVYDQSSVEQPPGSRDRCFFTTIPGYNEMLKGASDGSTRVADLRPEDAYTRPGAEDHFLYGDRLIFMNTIVALESSTLPGFVPLQDDPLYMGPRPDGACFDPQNTLDQLPPV